MSHAATHNWADFRAEFAQSRARPFPRLSADHGLCAAHARAFGRSLARFRLGEQGEGRIVQEIRRFRAPGIDDDYREALTMFVAEEGRHARILGEAVRHLGAQNLSRNWTASLFTHGRRFLGVRTKLLVLLTAELVAVVAYSALASRLPDGELREALREIRGDEERHLAFHARFFATTLRSGLLRRCVFWALSLLSALAVLSVLVDHARTFWTLRLSPMALFRGLGLALQRSRDLMIAPTNNAPRRRLRWVALVALTIGGASLWLVPAYSVGANQDLKSELSARLVHTWTHAAERHAALAALARQNPEWRLLHGLFSGLSFANLALSDRAHGARYVTLLDRVIEELRSFERLHGQRAFLLPYGSVAPFLVGPQRSGFVDGELALLLGARQLVARELSRDGAHGIAAHPEYTRELASRVQLLLTRMKQSRVACVESYPGECWMFCTTVSLAAVRMLDALEGSDHRAEFGSFSRIAREKLTDPATGLLISSFTLDGQVKDGPEGSSLWMVVHALALFDPALAKEQYVRAREALDISFFGFAAAREWPDGHQGPMDVDVGFVLPEVEAAAASSGFAILAAGTFGDRARIADLTGTIDVFAAFLDEDARKFLEPGYELGSTVIAYGLVQGPLWKLLESQHP